MSPSIVRTVLGDIDADSLGPLDYHEHLFQESPLLPGDEINDETRSEEEALALHVAGIDVVVEATPTGLAPRPAAVARISDRTGLRIVHTTGTHHRGHYGEGHPVLAMTVDDLTERFVDDVRGGMEQDGRPAYSPGGSRVRAGIVKSAARYWSIGAFERRSLEAAARTGRSTGCPVMVHLDHGSAAHEVLDILDSHGLPADQVVLAHIDRNLDPEYHVSLAERGAYLGFDGFARYREAPDSAILDCIHRVAAHGHADRVLLGGDVARATRYIAYDGMPGLAYLPDRVFPRLRALVGDALFETMLIDNGRRFLSMRATADRDGGCE